MNETQSMRRLWWAFSGWSWLQIESQLGCSEAQARDTAEELGFRRQGGSQNWESGPCVMCGEHTRPRHLDMEFRCSGCSPEFRSGYRWGTEPPPGSRWWFDLEREASWLRRHRPNR